MFSSSSKIFPLTALRQSGTMMSQRSWSTFSAARHHPSLLRSARGVADGRSNSSGSNRSGWWRGWRPTQQRHAFYSIYRMNKKELELQNRSMFLYGTSVVIVMGTMAYAASPLYKIFCAATGFAGTPKTGHLSEPENMVPLPNGRPIRITFNSDVNSSLEWEFIPQQKQVIVVPGETALAFYTAKNLTDKDVVGIATYNVTPMKVGQYFNKIQCFCFEYQRLRPGEELDMPVFFYIDPEFDSDPYMDDVDVVTLSYTFFKAQTPKSATEADLSPTLPLVTAATSSIASAS